MEREITVELVPLDEDHDELRQPGPADSTGEQQRARPCCFCSTPEHQAVVRERGIITAEYRMENTYGVTLGYTCGMCVSAERSAGSTADDVVPDESSEEADSR